MDVESFTRQIESDSAQVDPNDAKLIVQFYMAPMKDDKRSAEEGRDVYREEEFIAILVPGESAPGVNRPVWDGDRQRFRAKYEAWKAGKSAASEGTPLGMWPAVSKAQVAELNYFNIKTIEQLADLSDEKAMKFMGIQALKKQAQDFLAAAKSNAPLTKLRAELEQRDNEIALLKSQMADVISKMNKK